ncbi:caspase family protein [Nonomuraea typhae]|uniref:caspase family protein n=1 Tax=Nonomuraea typhae TaxID=2603600 RepID=UPI0015E1CC82|nr:caspase family protein [Nonomuraea typhae]
MQATRAALLIATTTQEDPGLAQLRSPASDVGTLETALRAGFDVRSVSDAARGEILAELTAFFSGRGPDDVLLLYLACHAVVTPAELVLATRATTRSDPAAASVPFAAVTRVMAATDAGHVVLVLDCCFSGPERGAVELTAPAQVLLSATDTVEYVFDQGMIRGRGAPSKLTPALAEILSHGLPGEPEVTATALRGLPAAVVRIDEPGLLLTRGVALPRAPAPVQDTPRRTSGDWAVRVLYWGLVLVGLSFLAMLASGWVAWRIWQPGMPGDALDLLGVVLGIGLALLGVGTVLWAVAFAVRRWRARK